MKERILTEEESRIALLLCITGIDIDGKGKRVYPSVDESIAYVMNSKSLKKSKSKFARFVTREKEDLSRSVHNKQLALPIVS